MRESNMSKESNRIHWLVIVFLLSFSLLGTMICHIIDLITPGEGTSVMSLSFGIIWVVTLGVLGPIQIFVFERRARKGQELQKLTAKDIIGLPFGAVNPNAKIHKWIAIPVLTVLYLVVGIFVLFLAMILIGYLVSKFAGN
jgi:hypothetical protein